MSLCTTTANLLIGTGIIHCGYGILVPELRYPLLRSIHDVTVVVSDINEHYARECTFWFQYVGIMLVMLGYYMRSSTSPSSITRKEGTTEELPKWFGWTLTIMGIIGTTLMPASGFWLILAQGIRILWIQNRTTMYHHNIVSSLSSSFLRNTGNLLFGTGMIHCMFGIIVPELRDPLLRSVMDMKIVVPNDIHERYARKCSFWFQIAGFMMMIQGNYIIHPSTKIERQNKERVPKWLGYTLTAMGIVGITFMPVSGFWFVLVQGIRIIWIPEKGKKL